MAAKILKWWHQWSWAYHVAYSLIIITGGVVAYENAIANNTNDIAELKKQHTEENMAVRMAKQEQVTQDTHEQLGRIEQVQGKIFDRINTIVDRGR